MNRVCFAAIAAFVIAVTALSLRAQEGDVFVGGWKLDLGATASINTTTRQVDRTTVEKTTTTTVGRGAADTGSLRINSDGTYRLDYWYYGQMYNQSTVSGRWKAVPANTIYGSLSTIELTDAVPDDSRSAEMRKWYVIQKDDGSIEARYPPHDGYAKIKMTRGGGGGAKAAAAQKRTSSPPATGNTSAEHKGADTAPASTTRTWTPEEVRRHLNGKTKSEVIAILGQPVKAAYGTYSFNGVDKIFPPCPNGCNYRSFAIQFGGPGETVNSVELQYWVVEP